MLYTYTQLTLLIHICTVDCNLVKIKIEYCTNGESYHIGREDECGSVQSSSWHQGSTFNKRE